MCHSTYITVVNHYQSIIRVCSGKEGDAHDCRSRASTACKTPQRSKDACLQVRSNGRCASAQCSRGAGTREGHEYTLRKDYCSRRRNGHNSRGSTRAIGKEIIVIGWTYVSKTRGSKPNMNTRTLQNIRGSIFEQHKVSGWEERAANGASRAALSHELAAKSWNNGGLHELIYSHQSSLRYKAMLLLVKC